METMVRNENLRPNQGRAQYALWSMLFLAVIKVVVVVTYYMQYHLLSQWINGSPVDMVAANANDKRVLIVGIIDLLARLGVIIAVIFWFRRAYYNLHLRFKNLTYSEGWAAGGWFVPFMSLYVPYQIFSELFENTKKFLIEHRVKESHSLKTGLLLVWWLIWIINNLGENIFSRVTNDETDIHKITNFTLVDIGFALMSLVALVLFIFMVKSYSEIEPIFHAKLDEVRDKIAMEELPKLVGESDLTNGPEGS